MPNIREPDRNFDIPESIALSAGRDRLGQNVTVASYRRRHHLAEEVPGLYIRRLTLEDPRRREPSGSRSQSPARHICHPRSGCARSVRGSSYRSWLERIRKESPPFLTIVSLELPESPIPLIESQANARLRRDGSNEAANDKDDILDEFLERVTEVGKDKEREVRIARNSVSWKSHHSSKKDDESLECTKAPATLEECTRNIIEGPSCEGSNRPRDTGDDCICCEIPGTKDLRINIRRKTEVTRTLPCTPSPEMTHAIRIAMKYHDRIQSCDTGCKTDDDESPREEQGGGGGGGGGRKASGGRGGERWQANEEREEQEGSSRSVEREEGIGEARRSLGRRERHVRLHAKLQ
ncbi:uncharacterized protein LOC105429275 [Pogonomyrmex barbatus]|uniref:Uncharacterized protein LOC105429275 n=1 Tax=Pogonomyrmex barbatus TaxID=144034 RepID=A0A8N1S8Y8_9HYME|nr:uncharacterized protein LOC105429275 [Pogonomyrmex barbatus]